MQPFVFILATTHTQERQVNKTNRKQHTVIPPGLSFVSFPESVKSDGCDYKVKIFDCHRF